MEMTTHDYTKALGETIAALRRATDVSQSELAQRCGVSRMWVAAIEAGRQKGSPRVSTLTKVASQFGLTAGKLLVLAEKNSSARR